MDKTKYTKRIYKENMRFKEYVDKLLADSNDYNKEPDIWENETVYDVAQYYESMSKTGIGVLHGTVKLKCSCEEEDKSC